MRSFLPSVTNSHGLKLNFDLNLIGLPRHASSIFFHCTELHQDLGSADAVCKASASIFHSLKDSRNKQATDRLLVHVSRPPSSEGSHEMHWRTCITRTKGRCRIGLHQLLWFLLKYSHRGFYTGVTRLQFAPRSELHQKQLGHCALVTNIRAGAERRKR